jgi:RecA-family ATPase
MNPMKNTTGVTNQDVAFFRNTLIEFDELEPSKQLAVFQKLNLPISAIVWSGRRSYHAWVRVDAANLDSYNSQVAKLHETLSKFGVDSQTKSASRLTRLPGVCRGNDKQKLIYIKQ